MATTFKIKNLRTTATGAYSASLYEDGKRVAVISDEGRGGAPRVEPIKAENWGRERDRLETALAAWAATNLPRWYLTSDGKHPALDADNYELAIGYIVECFENDRDAKGLGLYRRPDGALFRAPAGDPDAKARGYKFWTGTDWVAAA